MKAGYTIIGKEEAHIKPVLVSSLSVFFALVLFIPFSIPELSAFNISNVTTGQWLSVIWWGAGTISLGLTLWYFGIEKVSGVEAGFMGLMSVSALIFSYILLKEPFYISQQAIGFIVVFISIILLTYSPKGKGMEM